MGRLSLLPIGLLLLAGCDSPLGKGWKPDLSLDRLGESFVNAATSPKVWLPAAGAVMFQIDDWDERASDWAVKHTPIYGSREDATQWSDDLESAAIRMYIGVTAATPTGENGAYDVNKKLWEAGLGAAAMGVTSFTTTTLKDATGRERPDGGNDKSFPSAHSSATAAASTLTSRYPQYWSMPEWAETTVDVGLVAMPYAVGWARIEAERHFPSDVLAGIAIGNFFASFVNELLDKEHEEDEPPDIPEPEVDVIVAPYEGGAWVGLSVRF